jgi:transcriptional regulator with GAF, ATPase, and Fis domain
VAELLERRPDAERSGAANPGGIVGRAPSMAPVFAALRRVAPTDTTVLIIGETGTGKELAARAVHELSPRSRGPFLAVNCGALGEGVLESELFGHVRGAFTGAMRDRAGVFESARGGTIFLDEVGEVSIALQQRLLRVLQEREITRVGASHASKIDVRIVAATNRDLHALVREGRFRDDLLYRLAVFPLTLPPLRERRADIPLLAMHALAELRGRAAGREALSCSPFAMRLLREYGWPGNVRQLFSVLEAAAIHADFRRIEAQHLPAEIRQTTRSSMDDDTDSRYRATEIDGDERAAIAAALEETSGALAKTAELLGMSRTTLWRKMRLYGM